MPRTCSIFGHAPDALPVGYDPCLYNIDLIFCMRELLEVGIKEFITGLVPGVDLWCARTLINHMEHGDCVVRGYMPFPVVCDDKPNLRRIKSLRAQLPFIAESPGMTPEMQARWMINDSTDVFVITAGGTIPFPVRYALKKKKRLTVLHMESIIEKLSSYSGGPGKSSSLTIPRDRGKS